MEQIKHQEMIVVRNQDLVAEIGTRKCVDDCVKLDSEKIQERELYVFKPMKIKAKVTDTEKY